MTNKDERNPEKGRDLENDEEETASDYIMDALDYRESLSQEAKNLTQKNNDYKLYKSFYSSFFITFAVLISIVVISSTLLFESKKMISPTITEVGSFPNMKKDMKNRRLEYNNNLTDTIVEKLYLYGLSLTSDNPTATTNLTVSETLQDILKGEFPDILEYLRADFEGFIGNETTPQRQAFEMLYLRYRNDDEFFSYDHKRILRQYIILTIHYAMDGLRWRSPWYVIYQKWQAGEEADECSDFRGIVCNEENNEIIALDLRNRMSSNYAFGSIPTELWHLTTLESLNLSPGNYDLIVSLPSEIQKLTRLTYFNPGRIKGSIPTEIGQLTQLQYLRLFYEKRESATAGSIPTEIGQLTQLVTLSATRLNGNIPTEISNCLQLSELSVSLNTFSSTLPTEIGELSQLQNLYLKGFAGTIPEEIALLSRLTSINLSGNQFVGTIPREMAKLTQVKKMYLNNNRLNGNIPTEMGRLTQLQFLYLSNNALDGTIPSEIGQMQQILFLKLNNNKLTGTLPTEIGQLTRIIDLTLSNNALSGNIPTEIGTISSFLVDLNLSHNRFSGEIPKEMISLLSSPRSFLDDEELKINYFLHDNDFSGTIPLINNDDDVRGSFTIHNNTKLIGTIPRNACDDLKIYVDCDNIECDCCRGRLNPFFQLYPCIPSEQFNSFFSWINCNGTWSPKPWSL